jgi:hypothetical protein
MNPYEFPDVVAAFLRASCSYLETPISRLMSTVLFPSLRIDLTQQCGLTVSSLSSSCLA